MRGLSATVMFRHGLIPLTIRNHVFGTIPGRTSAFLKSIRRIDSGFGAFKKSSLIPGGVTERRSSLPFRSEYDVALTVRVALIVSLVVVLFAAFNWLTARQLFRLHPRRKGIVIALLIAGNGMWLFLPWLRVRSDAMRLIRATLGPPGFGWLRVERVPIAIDALPPAAEGMRIAVIGDMHVGLFSRPSRLRTIFETARAQRPDLVR